MSWASGAGKRRSSGWLPPEEQESCAQPPRRGEGGVVQGLGDEKGAGTHPKNWYFWANPCWTELEQVDSPILSVLKISANGRFYSCSWGYCPPSHCIQFTGFQCLRGVPPQSVAHKGHECLHSLPTGTFGMQGTRGSGEEKPLLGLILFFSARFSEEICLGQVVWGSPGPFLGAQLPLGQQGADSSLSGRCWNKAQCGRNLGRGLSLLLWD